MSHDEIRPSSEHLESDVATLTAQLESCDEYLATTNAALKKIRKKAGAAAHKRSWSLEEQIERYEAKRRGLIERIEELGRNG